jgi:glutamate/tyrosine decarboxylase-like PLP-dependent enzyme
MTLSHEKTGLQDSRFLIQEAARIATDYLADHGDRSQPVVRQVSAAELLKRIDIALPATGRPLSDLLEDVRQTLHYSVRTGHPGFSNQLFGDYDPAALLGEWMTALLNTSMYTFEVAPVVTLMETALMQHMCGFVGWHGETGEGVLTPGGSIANLMAVLGARNRCCPEAKERGLGKDSRLVLLMSAEAHYSIERAASVVGLGSAAVRTVAVDALGRMDPAALQATIARALAEGERPFFLCATASTTVAGAFDPIEPLADIAEQHGLWLHVDAACGGGVLLSPRYRSLMAGCERADSVTWNPHKMMGIPLACSALLVRERGRLAATHAMGADYLFHTDEDDDARFDLGDITLQCGRRVDSLKLWLSWQALGDEGHARRIERMFEVAGTLHELLAEREGFEIVREPQGCNTCFQWVPERLRNDETSAARSQAIGKATVRIRGLLRAEGRLLINYAPLDGVSVFRHVANNARVTSDDLSFLLDEIERHGRS